MSDCEPDEIINRIPVSEADDVQYPYNQESEHDHPF